MADLGHIAEEALEVDSRAGSLRAVGEARHAQTWEVDMGVVEHSSFFDRAAEDRDRKRNDCLGRNNLPADLAHEEEERCTLVHIPDYGEDPHCGVVAA